ncbi:MAG: hypothetical protein M3Y40_09205 [Chloroflexota bacterium]|nr:hypothetical protein [Chloroflexota bacterium]
MKWRPLSTYRGETDADTYAHGYRYDGPDGYPDEYLPDPAQMRSAALSQSLARLEAATRLRDGDAAARVLAGMADTEDGQWLLRQCVAAGLRDVARHIADPDLRSIGPAA